MTKHEFQKKARDEFRRALMDNKTRSRVARSINQGKDIDVPVGGETVVRVTILSGVNYRK